MNINLMLAVNLDELDIHYDIAYPCIGQPKLDGVRAYWDGHILRSRQQKVFSADALPHIYAKLQAFSAKYPGIILDGELYGETLPFQEICARVAINRSAPHPDATSVDFHAFDIISADDTETRQTTLCQIYRPWVAVTKLLHPDNIELWTSRFYEAGFEGMMIRQLKCPYISGRTQALIKVKPWQYCTGVIVGLKRGQGKYIDTLGSIEVKIKDITCFVSGGLTDKQRDTIWRAPNNFLNCQITLKYRELSNTGRLLKPQIVNILPC